jgi:hypothetical protein
MYPPFIHLITGTHPPECFVTRGLIGDTHLVLSVCRLGVHALDLVSRVTDQYGNVEPWVHIERDIRNRKMRDSCARVIALSILSSNLALEGCVSLGLAALTSIGSTDIMGDEVCVVQTSTMFEEAGELTDSG